MPINTSLKPFIFNLNDIEFVLAQVNFLPLFDAGGNAIIDWNGTGAIYNQSGALIWDGTGLTAQQAQSNWGTSYAHITASQGIRTNSGIDNNLLLVNRTWGAADAEFVRKLGLNYTFVEQAFDPLAVRNPATVASVTAGTPQPDLSAALDLVTPTSTTTTSTVSDSAPTTAGSYTSPISGVTYTIQYFSRTTQDVITATHVIEGGREFVTWNKIDIQTQEQTQLIILDSTGEHIDSTTSGPLSPMTSHIFMSGGELDLQYHGFASVGVNNAADLAAVIAQGYAPTSINGTATDAAVWESGAIPAAETADIRLGNVIDYTPRMITQTITTAGVDMLTVGDLFAADAIPAGLNPNHIVYNTMYLNDGITLNPAYTQGKDPSLANFKLGAVEGVAIVQDYGMLATLGIDDHQNANNTESFIGSTNPGVAPTNGFFAIFGQFFDHGLDFIAKNGQTDAGTTAKIKIALAVDDPLYGVIGPDGRPTTEITITRATPQGVDENGAPTYINHTSPFVDQSQSYGSVEQIGALLREWVEDPNNPGTYVPGVGLIDSNTLANTWTRWDGVETNQTLVTVNALRDHLIETGRDDLTWEDIGDVRNRDASGHIDGSGTSGHALLLDMNPRFDGARMDAADVAAVVDTSIATLNAILQTAGPGSTSLGVFSQAVNGDLQLDLVAGAMGPGSPAATFTGASALAPFVNFADFSIYSTLFGMVGMAAVDHTAVSEILLASVGDHYLSGDGRVNENVGLTTIHHVFHEEHNFQVQNIETWVLRQDDHKLGADHSIADEWMTAVTHISTPIVNPALVGVVGGHFEAISGLLASDINGDIYVVPAGTTTATDPNFVDFIRTPPIVDAQGNQQNGTPISAVGLMTRADGYLSWNLEKVFEGTRLIVETEYNHVATDQFAGAVTPDIGEFVGYNSGRDSSITLEFAQNAYRYGHSTLRETIDVIDPDGGLTSKIMSYALEAAFLKPELYAELGPDAITLGQTRQQMNEIDEFITPALNQGLLGMPLDLAAINIARGRDIGLPTFNEMRVALDLGAYTSWSDFGNNMQHSESLVNFIAAYALDGNVDLAQAIIDASNGDSAAAAIVVTELGGTNGVAEAITFLNGGNQDFNLIDAWLGGLAEVHVNGGLLGATFNTIFVDQISALKDGDRFYYLYRLFGQEMDEQVKAEQFKDIVERTTGTTHLNGNVFGYSEVYHDFGLNATWPSAVDLYGANGMVLVLAGNTFDPGVTYYNQLNVAYAGIPTAVNLYASNGTTLLAAAGTVPPTGAAFYDATGKFIGASQHRYGQVVAQHANDANGLNHDGSVNYGVGIYSDAGGTTASNGQLLTFAGIMAAGAQKFILDMRVALSVSDQLDGEPGSGADAHEVIVGTDFDDVIYARAGDDAVYGDAGNDLIFGGNGGDYLNGGDGHDTIYGGDGPEVADGGAGDDLIYGDSSESAAGGTDLLIGGEGNDTIYGGTGIDELIGNGGDDVLFGGDDTDPFTRAGDGNDYIDGGASGDILNGDGGDDLIVGGDDQDIVAGGDGDDILRPGRLSQALGGGPDEVLGGDGKTDTGFDLLELNDFDASPLGQTIDLNNQANPLLAVDGITPNAAMTQVEGVIGTQNDDTFIGNAAQNAVAITTNNWFIGGSGSDTFNGNDGNDVIIGGSIRLDWLIGQYETTAGSRAVYNSYDAYLGASHRVDPNAVLSDGLLGNAAIGTEMFSLHFTEFLKSNMFKDYVLGNATQAFDPLNPEASGTAATDIGSVDRALYSGNRDDYTVEVIHYMAAGGNAVVAYKVSDNRTAADFLDGNGAPLLDANGNLLANEGTDLLVGVQQLVFADETLDFAPQLALVGQATTLGPRDNFSTQSYANNDPITTNGSVTPWASNWQETADDAGGSPTSGQIQISNSHLVFGQGNGATIDRQVNLAGATSATLNFSYNTNGLDGTANSGERVDVYFAADGVNFGSRIGVIYSGSSNGTSINLGGTFTDHGVLRFVASDISSFNEYAWVDNVRIEYQGLIAQSVNFSDTYLEGAGAKPIANMAVITDYDGTTLESARVVLTNAVVSQDHLSISGFAGTSGTLASGITFNIVTVGNQIRVDLSGTADHAAYQNAIDLVRYDNSVSGPNVSPDGTPRVIEVTVFDGAFYSAIATATIDVVAVDFPVAVADHVITNITGGSLAIAKTALLANDTDANGDPLTVNTIGNAVGGTVSQNANDVVFAPPAGPTVLSANFASNTNGFTYQDNYFGGTGQNASGIRVTAGNGGNNGALHLDLGGGNGNTNMNGAFTRVINVATAGTYTLNFDYRNRLSGDTETGENSQVIVSVNGNAIGNNGVVNTLLGPNSNGPDLDTGWQSVSVTVNLVAGNNTLALGGNMTANTYFTEVADIDFDNIQISQPSTLTSGSFTYTVLDHPPVGPSNASISAAPVDIQVQAGPTLTGTATNEILIARDEAPTAVREVVTQVASNSNFSNNANNSFSFAFTGNASETESITEIRINLGSLGFFDQSGAGSKAFSVGNTSDVAASAITVTSGDTSELVLTFAPGTFQQGDVLRFGIDTDSGTANMENGENLGQNNIPFSVKFSDATTLSGTYTTGGPGSTGTVTAATGPNPGTTITGAGGNDQIIGGNANDTIIWNVGDGTDTVDGGAGNKDTFVVNGNAQTETYNVIAPNAAPPYAAYAQAGRVVITRTVGGTTAVVASLINIEELVFNLSSTGGGDATVATRGTFTGLISQNTITINAGEGHVMVDLSQMTSDEHVVVNSGGTYQIVDGDGRNLTVNGGTPSNDNAAPSGTETGTTNETAQQGDASPDGTPDAPADAGTTDNPVPATDTADANHIGLTLTGDSNANTLIGSEDSDLMFGGDGADNIVGAGGSDMLFGDDGNDRIFGGEGHDVIDGGAGNDIVFAGDGNDLIIAEANDGSDTYWGEAGTDTLDYAAVSANIEVDLGSGLLGRGQVVIGAETDTIYGFENVITGAGNDRIIANASVNTMDGGAGNDTFVFGSVEAANGDTIFNFAPGDKIDLSGIDADHGAAGQQSFVLFATGSFSAAGQLMVTFETHDDGEHTIISGNVDDDTEADFSIDLVGRHLLTGSDFSGVN